MRIARYSVDDTIRYGVVELEPDGGVSPGTVADLTGDPFVGGVKLTGVRHPLEDVRWLAPVLPRSKVISVVAGPGGKTGFYLKPNTSVVGPGDAIVVPGGVDDVRLGVALAVVIGRICRSVPAERVPEAVFGYTVGNDVTAAGLIRAGLPWGMGTAWDSFTPLGPWIVTHLSIEEASGLDMTALVGDDPVRGASTRDLVWDIVGAVGRLSEVMTLLPGDVILIGPPDGTAPIKSGQPVVINIDEIGALINTVMGPV